MYADGAQLIVFLFLFSPTSHEYSIGGDSALSADTIRSTRYLICVFERNPCDSGADDGPAAMGLVISDLLW